MRYNKMKLVSLFLATLHLISAQEVTDNETPSVNYIHIDGSFDLITLPKVRPSLHRNNETTGDSEHLKYITLTGPNIKKNGDNKTEFVDKSGKSILHSGIDLAPDLLLVNAALYSGSKLPSVFDLSDYINKDCTVNKTLSRCNSTCEKCEESVRQSAIKLCHDFQGVMVKVMYFLCNLHPKSADAAIMICKEYIDRCKSFPASDEYVKSNATVYHLMEAIEMANCIEKSFMILFTQIQKIRNLKRLFGPLNRTFVYGLIAEEETKLISQLEAYIQKLDNLLDHMKQYKQQDIFMTMYFTPRLDKPQMEYLLTTYRENLNGTVNSVELWRSVDVIRIQVKLVVLLLVFILGSLGNILLLVIFIRHDEMRTAANLMIINLTVVNCLSLVFNIPLAYMKTTSIWTLGLGVCRFFYFVRNIVISVSTYSVVMISLQRFLAVTQFPTAQGCRMGIKTKSVLMLATVWFLGTLYSLPIMFLANLDEGMCVGSDEYLYDFHMKLDLFVLGGGIGTDEALYRFQAIFDLFYICILPSIWLLVFSLLTASKIKKSVSNVPGERAGQEQLRKDRMLSAHVLTALSVLFPVNVFYFMRFWFVQKMDRIDMCIVDVITYVLMFTNTCLNPVALCVMSRKYRKYFKEYLFCWNSTIKISANTSATDASISTTESAN